MRILTFTSLFPNASHPLLAVFVYQRTAHLARVPGNTVQVVAPLPYAPSWFPGKRWQLAASVPREESIGGLDVFHPRYPLVPKISMPLHGFLMFMGCASLVRHLHQEHPFDCIDAHFVYPDGFAACLLGKMLKIPVLVSARGTDMTLYPTFKTIRPLVRWTLQHAAGLAAVSESLKEAMVQVGAPPEKIRVISNGVDADLFFLEPLRDARETLGLPRDSRILVSVGNLLPVKCHERLIYAVADLRERFPTLRGYIIGEGIARPRLERLIAEANLRDRVHLVGSKPNDELRTWFSAADASCLFSSREGWPNVVSESIACGTPVVATGVGGVPEIISSPDLGIVVEQDASAISAGIAEALGRNWNREGIAAYGRRRTWDVVGAEVSDYLRVLCKPR